MLKSVLIANRGEIACRVARTARRMGLRVVAVYSEADRDAPHVRLADAAVAIGPAPASASYLDGAKLIAAARAAGADCVHPGYGFLSENANFAESCAAAGLVFVGPPPAAIRAMGLKDGAKALMQRAGVPVVPGYHGARQEPRFLKEKSYEIGYPVLIKAVAGGGGKGMRRVDRHAEFDAALEGAQREAAGAFGNPHVLIEKYVETPRHIEMQVFGDAHGNVVHLFERDCSLQRRHQKVIEEAPAPGMDAATRAAMAGAAVAAAKAVAYQGAGTVEFIADGSGPLRPDGFYFMEMNTRLQVEHPVTEMITGLDLVEWQFRVAAGEPLPLRQEQIACRGHAVEARLYAEDPELGFLPSSGRLRALRFPPQGEGLRIDSGVAEGGEVTPYYDPMIAKVIAHAPSRDAAFDRLAAALAATRVAGPRCNAAFLRALCLAPEFRAGRFDTGFIERNLEALGATPRAPDAEAIAAGAHAALAARAGLGGDNPWDARDAFQLSGERRMALQAVADGVAVQGWLAGGLAGRSGAPSGRIVLPALHYDAEPRYRMGDGQGEADAYGGPLAYPIADGCLVLHRGRQTEVVLADLLAMENTSGETGDGRLRAPMHGRIVALVATLGQSVERGARIAIVEAMKMEHALAAPFAGVVAELHGAAGDQVVQGALIARITRHDAGETA